MDGGDLWLASETCLDIASNVDREEASVFARQRAHATLDGMSPSHRKSWVGKALAVVDAAPSATTLFQPTRRAFLPLSHHSSLTRTLTNSPQTAIDLLYLQPFLSPAPNTLFVHLFSLGH